MAVPAGMGEGIERPVFGNREIRTHRIELSSNQTNDSNIDTCHFLARCMAVLGEGKDWFAQCLDNVIEWDIRLWWGGLGSQSDNTIHCHVYTQSQVLILPSMLQIYKTPTTNPDQYLGA